VIEITETWTTVDRWWTDEPVRRHYVALRSPDLEEDVRACVWYDEQTKHWSLIEEGDRPDLWPGEETKVA
jgi:hypothetical protein